MPISKRHASIVCCPELLLDGGRSRAPGKQREADRSSEARSLLACKTPGGPARAKSFSLPCLRKGLRATSDSRSAKGTWNEPREIDRNVASGHRQSDQTPKLDNAKGIISGIHRSTCM